MSTPVTHLSIKLGEKTIELTADEARKLYGFLSDLFKQDSSSPLPGVPLPPWNQPIIVPSIPQWPQYPAQPFFGDPPGWLGDRITCGGTPRLGLVQTDFADGVEHPRTRTVPLGTQCLNVVL